MNIFLALVKGVFEEGDVHVQQVQAILGDIMADETNFDDDEQLDSFIKFACKMDTFPHSIESLDVALQDYKSEELGKRMAAHAGHELKAYNWKKVGKSSYSNLINKEFAKFKAKYEVKRFLS